MRRFTAAMMVFLALTGCAAKAKPAATTPTTEAPPTPGQIAALKKANSYLRTQAFSRDGLIRQLSSPSGSNLPLADATWAVDHVDADWTAEALESANGFMAVDPPPATCEQLMNILTNFELFTTAQATAGAEQAENSPC